MTTLGERITYIRKQQQPKMSQADFAASLGMSRPAYAMYEIDRVVPNATFFNLFCMKYGVNPIWLETGEGDPFEPRKVDLAQEISDIMRGEDPFAAAVLTSLASMPPEWWQVWHDKLMQVIAEKNTRG